MKYNRSIIKWAGGKYAALKHIIPHLVKAERLVEPFMGGGCVFLNTDYPAYLLAEKNKDLIELYTTLKTHGPRFISHCKTFFKPEFNTTSAYYEIREQFNTTTDPFLKSALFLYLNRHGYNGLCRYNSSNQYNVPFGQIKKPYFPDKEMNHFYEKCPKVTFRHADFRETFQSLQKGDLVYCDPPYVALSKTANFTSYTADGFSEGDQQDLVDYATLAAKNGITVLISNHDTEQSRALYKQAEIYDFSVSRYISSNTQNRRPAGEILAIFR